jgi:glutathionylspermidine synthase
MQRIACEERPDWRETAEAVGFLFHTMDGEPYWDESAYYGFSLYEIEHDIEAPTAELDGMCRELVGRAIDDERLMRALQIPQPLWNFIAASFRRGDPSLYGRFDLRYDGQSPAKLLEYNADTPTSVFETAVFQWNWHEDAIARGIVRSGADQYNSLHERLIERWKTIGQSLQASGGHLHLAGVLDSPEDHGTLVYLEDTARQAGLGTTTLAIGDIGRNAKGQFVDGSDQPIALAFKLYPWEWMFRETFAASLGGASTRWVEPPWKAILSSKGILPLLWEMFPHHPNLLPAYFEADLASARLGKSFVRKPLYSREGANVEIVVAGEAIEADRGPYGAEGFIKQEVATLPRFDDNYAVVGSWVVGGVPSGLSMREDTSPITKNTSRFLPHAIIE